MTDTPSSDAPGRREFYDSTAGVYRATFHLIWRLGFPGLHRWLREEVGGRRVILDAGAASGYWTRVIARDVDTRVVALDFSWPYVRMAQRYLRRQPNAYVVQGDILALPMAEASVDVVLCSGVLDTLPAPGAALSEFRRVLRPGGRLLLVIRGRDEKTSGVTEKIIRTTLSASRRVTTKGRRSSMDSHVWKRSGVWPRLTELANQAALDIVSVEHGRLVTSVSLEPR
jgi:ubiquinone/menaquinone biosynthesis C-methylase UbiE